MWGSRIPLDHAERSTNLYAPLVNIGLIYCWMFGVLIPIVLVTLVSLFLHEGALYFGDVFAGETPTSFGTSTAHVIGLYFSGQFAFFDLARFANPMSLLGAVVSIGVSIWLVVRLLRHRFGMPEFVVFCVTFSFNIISLLMILAGLAPRAIEQLLRPLAERDDASALIEASHLLTNFAFVVWVALYAVRSFF